MKSNRRDFLKKTGMAGIGLAGGVLSSSKKEKDKEPFEIKRRQRFNMHGYAAPALDVVRVGLTGIGNRGSGTVQRLASLDGVEIKAINDLEEDRVKEAIDGISATHSPDGYYRDENDWKRMCERDDIDLIAIQTPWHLHVEQAVYAMEHGKHIYCELPAANTIEECWQLVETSENTRQHFVQMSASCHGGISAVVLNMVRNDVFGEVIHGEGSYIHDLMNDYNFTKHMYHNMWRLNENIDRHGNLYPQHGLIPVMQMMDINYGDQMDYMVSTSTNDFMMADRARELAEEDEYWEPYVGRDFRGNLNTSIVRTRKGKTMMLQHDVTTPRPAVRFDLISGTKGAFKARPNRIGFSYNEGWISQDEFDALVEEYTPEINKRFSELMERAEEPGRAQRSYARVNPMDWRLIDCLRNGLPVDIDVYDSAASSAITPLSEWSVANRSNSVSVPDFTDGAWETNERGMDVQLEKGGGNTRIL
jgi:hypothetical protein